MPDTPKHWWVAGGLSPPPHCSCRPQTPLEAVELPGGVTGTAAETWAWITATGPVSTGETPGAAEGLAAVGWVATKVAQRVTSTVRVCG